MARRIPTRLSLLTVRQGLGVCDRNNSTIAGKSLTNARELAQEQRALLQRGLGTPSTRATRTERR